MIDVSQIVWDISHIIVIGAALIAVERKMAKHIKSRKTKKKKK